MLARRGEARTREPAAGRAREARDQSDGSSEQRRPPSHIPGRQADAAGDVHGAKPGSEAHHPKHPSPDRAPPAPPSGTLGCACTALHARSVDTDAHRVASTSEADDRQHPLGTHPSPPLSSTVPPPLPPPPRGTTGLRARTLAATPAAISPACAQRTSSTVALGS